ncbi:response regulator transcription factor [Luteimonas sp. FCS-9]|uniref:response regulator transcription factor n=1 Tax=Luteimonas sp. FCS-9 TaxID=1547516 RepID=UPI00063ECE5B|nr:response regulator transcription factor [Luteimonas sp. FCS-9]KLJ01416.1 transcriptional regulator [Luteimonas sp. FCS-9]
MRILLAEDDAELAARVAAALAAAGFAVDRVDDGTDAEFRGQTEAYDAAVLDLGLPGLDGVSVLHRWREAGLALPVLVLTARSRWHDKLAGFNAGADDYLTKPFQIEELVLRLQALIRRSAGHASPRLRCGGLELDAHAGRFALDGDPLALTAQEYRILAYLMHHAGRVVSRAELGEHVYDNGYDPDSNVLDVLVGRIRRKLGVALLHTVRGQGFRLSASP